MSPAISIILPTFNRLEYLRPAIDSAFAQTFGDWELIIADDGSNAQTREVLGGFEGSPRVKVIWLAHSGRPSVVRNAAMRWAQGEYIAFLDSDDVWLPKKLELQIASLRKNPQRKWSYTRFAVMDRLGDPVSSAVKCPAPSGWILELLLSAATVIALPSVLVERALLDRVGAFDEELVMCEDDELWFRLAAESEIDGVDEALTLVRRHGQHSGSDVIAWQDRRRVFEKALRAGRDGHLRSVLHKLRAETSVGLARSEAVSGKRLDALGTLLTGARHTWRYPHCWGDALKAAARAVSPQPVLALARRCRSRHSAAVRSE